MSRKSTVENQFKNFLTVIGDVFGGTDPSKAAANKVRIGFDGVAGKVLDKQKVERYLNTDRLMFESFDGSVVDRSALASLVMHDPQFAAATTYLQEEKKVLSSEFKLENQPKKLGGGPLSMLAFMRSLTILYYMYAQSALDPKTNLKRVQDEFNPLIANFVEQAKTLLNQGGGMVRLFGKLTHKDSKRTQAIKGSATPEKAKKYKHVKDDIFAQFEKQAQYIKLKLDGQWLASKAAAYYLDLPEMFVLKELAASAVGSESHQANDRNQVFIDLLKVQVDVAFQEDQKSWFFPKEALPPIAAQGRMKVSVDALEAAQASLYGLNTLLLASNKLAQAILQNFPASHDSESSDTFALLVDLYDYVNHLLHAIMNDLFNSKYFEAWIERVNRKATGNIDPNHLVPFVYEARGFGLYPLNMEIPFVKQIYRLKNECVAYHKLRFIAAILHYQTNFIAGIRVQFPNLTASQNIDALGQTARKLLDSLAYVHVNGEGNPLFKPMAVAMSRVKNDTLINIMQSRRAKYDEVLSTVSNHLAQANEILLNQINAGKSSRDKKKTAKEVTDRLSTLCAGLNFLSINHNPRLPTVRIELRFEKLYREDHLDILRAQLGDLLTNAEIPVDYSKTDAITPVEEQEPREQKENADIELRQEPVESVQTSVPKPKPSIQHTFHFQAESAQALFSQAGTNSSRQSKWNRFQYRMTLLNQSEPDQLVNNLLDVADGLFTHRYSNALSFKTRSGDRFVSWLMQSENTIHLTSLLNDADKVLQHARSDNGSFITPLLERERFERRLGEIRGFIERGTLNERRSYRGNQTALYKLIAIMIQARYYFNMFSQCPVKPSERQLLKQRREFFSPKAPIRETLGEVVPEAIN